MNDEQKFFDLMSKSETGSIQGGATPIKYTKQEILSEYDSTDDKGRREFFEILLDRHLRSK